jgi:SAM-dependent methyltransferase
MNRGPLEIQEFNREQRRYFESGEKRTMVPRDTPYIRRHVEELVRFGEILPGERVLEVGCGMGRHIFCLVEKGIRVEGLELSPILIERLHAFNTSRIDIPVHCCDVINFPPELEGRFDAVIGFFTLHHFHDLTECYRAMQRMIRTGGRIVFLEPNAYNPLYYMQILLTSGMTWQGDRGMLNMRRRIIFGAMTAAGLSNPALFRFGFFPPFVSNRKWGRRAEALLEAIPFLQAFRAFQIFRGERP